MKKKICFTIIRLDLLFQVLFLVITQIFASNKELINIFGFSIKLNNLVFIIAIFMVLSSLVFELYMGQYTSFHDSESQRREKKVIEINNVFKNQ